MKRMLITGASRGIGQNIAEYFANNYEIYLHYNNGKQQAIEIAESIQKNGGKVSLIHADLASENGVITIAKFIKQHGATLDVLVNNAGIFQKGTELKNIDWGIMQHSFNVNVLSAAKLTSLCIPFMPKTTQSNIIFLSSVATKLSLPDIAIYTAAKAAVEAFTLCFAKGLGPIRVNAIAPGVVPTGIHQQRFDSNKEREEQKLLNTFQKKSLTKNLGTTKQISITIDYILNNDNLTGEIIHINGGLAL